MDEGTGRLIGLFGMMDLLQEFSKSSDIADHILETPRLRKGWKDEFDRCWREAAKQCSDGDLRQLGLLYLQRPDPIIRHAGYAAPTFIDLVSLASNDVGWLLVVENPSPASLKLIKDRILAIDYVYLNAGVANELRLLGKGTCSDDYADLDAAEGCDNPLPEESVPPRPVPFLPLEAAIMDALHGKALGVEQLQAAVGGANLYRKPWRDNPDEHVLDYMKAQGRIAHDRKIGGYFRPDALPPGCQPKSLP